MTTSRKSATAGSIVGTGPLSSDSASVQSSHLFRLRRQDLQRPQGIQQSSQGTSLQTWMATRRLYSSLILLPVKSAFLRQTKQTRGLISSCDKRFCLRLPLPDIVENTEVTAQRGDGNFDSYQNYEELIISIRMTTKPRPISCNKNNQDVEYLCPSKR